MFHQKFAAIVSEGEITKGNTRSDTVGLSNRQHVRKEQLRKARAV